MCHRLSTLPLFVCLLSSLVGDLLVASDDIDFGRDIRPILSDKCFQCHGPDENSREADLRLDVRENLVKHGAFNDADPGESELLSRVATDDVDLIMPPADSGKELSQQERELLQRWILQGANYSAHWAFVPPVRPELPPIKNSQWPNNPIDHFVLAQNEKRSIEQNAEADRRTLIRRLYLDLHGLPPSPDNVRRFVDDRSDKAYHELVTELITKEHFGEKWARWWLDAARYADSDGYEKDKPRSVWFYRDWVIKAMNQNMPYDRFIIEQIAGDLLPNAGQNQRVATGFLRNSMVNEEGGADPEQFRVEGLFDRMDAIGKSILGVTTQCAQCHEHKYDPLTQREYYQMFAALNDCHEAMIAVFTPEQRKQVESVKKRIAQVDASIKQEHADWQNELESWSHAAAEDLIDWETVVPDDLPWEGQKFRVLEDGSIVSESYAPTKVTNTFRVRVQSDRITAFRLDLLTHPQLPRGGPGRSILGTAALSEFEVSIAPVEDPGKNQRIKLTRAFSDVNPPDAQLPTIYRDKDPEKDDRTTGRIDYAIDGNVKTAWTTDIGPGRRNVDRVAIFIPEHPVALEGEYLLSFALQQRHGGWNSDDNQNYLLGRYRFSITNQELPEQFLPAPIEAALRLPKTARTTDQSDQLFSYWRTTINELAKQNELIELAWNDFPESDSQLVVQAVAQSRKSHVYSRGDFLAPLEAVQYDAPTFLGNIAEVAGSTPVPSRLKFARWMVSPQSPTTARVIVNRIWQAYFGRGLVTTPEDFGFQGSAPTHPKLLEWLSVELIESGWDLKQIHRLIVESATYRQSSIVRDDLREADPVNAWLARGARFRVNAELVRDIALTVSGLLNDSVGGPSIYPPAPEFLFQPPASYGPKIWDTSQDALQYRRSLYVHSYRSVPYPVLQVFDAPKGDAACIRRERSNTPLQALVMLNEQQFVDFARALAARILRETPLEDDASKLQYAFELVLSRTPTEAEKTILMDLLSLQRSRLAAGEIDVEQLTGVPANIYRQLTGKSPDELSAWIVVARTILSLDETITKS